jgi:hypothetical protein
MAKASGGTRRCVHSLDRLRGRPSAGLTRPQIEAQTAGDREGRTQQLDRRDLDGVAAIEQILDREEGAPRLSQRTVEREVRDEEPA